MSDPKIADKKPHVCELDIGSYAYCTCGLSNNQPYCNGSHAGSEFKPMIFRMTEKKKVALCQCKHSKNPPFCDGSHSGL